MNFQEFSMLPDIKKLNVVAKTSKAGDQPFNIIFDIV